MQIEHERQKWRSRFRLFGPSCLIENLWENIQNKWNNTCLTEGDCFQGYTYMILEMHTPLFFQFSLSKRRCVCLMCLLTRKGGGYCFCLATHSGFAHSVSGHTDSYFLLVAHSARYWSAHHTWQTRFFNVASVKHWYMGAFFLGRTRTYLLLVILVGVKGDQTTEPNPLTLISSYAHISFIPCDCETAKIMHVMILPNLGSARHLLSRDTQNIQCYIFL